MKSSPQLEFEMTRSLAHQDHKERVRLLSGIALVSIILWQTYLGSIALYPFTILATWFHEMGHGIGAMLTGSRFERLLIFPDGSGVAMSLRPSDGYRMTDAFIATSGPLGRRDAADHCLSQRQSNTHGLNGSGHRIDCVDCDMGTLADRMDIPSRFRTGDTRPCAARVPTVAALWNPAPRSAGLYQRVEAV
jgi:hypothetical protein